METPNIGQLVPDNETRRDAIHIAVIPMICHDKLGFAAGENIKIINGIAVTCFWNDDDCIGIVDPFLSGDGVDYGEKFWLFLKPGSVTSLRHYWTHPAFNQSTPKAALIPDPYIE